jgi:hypothetical protein
MKIFSLEELEQATNKVDQNCILSRQSINPKLFTLKKVFKTSHPKGKKFKTSYHIYGLRDNFLHGRQN